MRYGVSQRYGTPLNILKVSKKKEKDNMALYVSFREEFSGDLGFDLDLGLQGHLKVSFFNRNVMLSNLLKK